MPESVKMWTEARDVSAMQEALSDIFKIVTEAADLDITMPGIEG